MSDDWIPVERMSDEKKVASPKGSERAKQAKEATLPNMLRDLYSLLIKNPKKAMAIIILSVALINFIRIAKGNYWALLDMVLLICGALALKEWKN